jgi:hypothetical protein
MSSLRIVLGNGSLSRYPQGGGHWSVRLQFLLGLRDLGHDAYLLELVYSRGNRREDEQRVQAFLERMQRYGLAERCPVLVLEHGAPPEINRAVAYGKSLQEIRELIRSADVLWNDCLAVRQPLLGLFRRRVLLDMDPGHLQVSALTVDMPIGAHDVLLTVGTKMHQPDCQVPTLGFAWRPCTFFVYLPMWTASPGPGPEAPFTSITHWTWGEELDWDGRRLSTSKRDAYLRYLELPQRAGRAFELAANILPDDDTGDRQLLESHEWKLVDPWQAVSSPDAYQACIARSRAEILCPKPIFSELRTGWFSDRSVCYLASGRPVLAEDTGFSDCLPTGQGLVPFKTMAEALEGVAAIEGDYARHTVRPPAPWQSRCLIPAVACQP